MPPMLLPWRLPALAITALSLTACADAGQDGVGVQTVSYGAQESQRADVYQVPRPADCSAAPAVVLIHGGGWGAGNRGEFADLARWLAQQGAVAISIDYRLSPKAHWPAQAEDAEQAVWWVREHAQSLRIDPRRVVAIGGSAGGHLAAWLGTTNRLDAQGTPSRVNAVVSLWGPWDLTATNVREDGKNMIAALMGPTAPREASPLFRIDAQSAPTMVIHGTADELVPPDQSTRACEALRAAHVACELMLLPGEGHGFTTKNAEPLAALARMADFVHRAVNGPVSGAAACGSFAGGSGQPQPPASQP